MSRGGDLGHTAPVKCARALHGRRPHPELQSQPVDHCLHFNRRISAMCGIAAIFSKSTVVEARLGEHLGAMLAQMSDRGPDSAGVAVYRDPAAAGASKVSLHSADAVVEWGHVRDGLARAF